MDTSSITSRKNKECYSLKIKSFSQRQRSEIKANNQPLVSVIIPAYNSSSTLEFCLKSLRSQTYPNIEIIVVDSFSKDDTRTTAQNHGASVFSVRALRSEARNYGAKRAGGELLFFVDADMELTPKVIEECVHKVVEEGCDAIMVPEVRVGEGFWAKCRAIERFAYIGDPLIESARVFRKKVFQKVNGYDEKLEAAEDWDLHARIEAEDFKIKSIKALIRHHDGLLTSRKLVMKRLHYGKTLVKYVKKHPKRAIIQYMPIRLSLFKNRKVLVRQPLLLLGFFFMRTIEYLATVIGILSGVLSQILSPL